MSPWFKAPSTDESGRLSPEALARARRRVRRSLAALVMVAVAAGFLAYGCSRLRDRSCCSRHPATTTTQATSCAPCPAATPSKAG